MLNKPPDWFVERLRFEFQDRLRIRWSIRKHEWHIEQKVGRGALAPFRISEADDSMIRARDGYWFIGAVRPGNTMPCPKCGCKLNVPELEWREVVCHYCRLQKRDGRTLAAYFPLGEALLEHLRKIDDQRGGLERVRDEADRANEQLIASRERDISNSIESATKDTYTRLAGIQSVGVGTNPKAVHLSKDF